MAQFTGKDGRGHCPITKFGAPSMDILKITRMENQHILVAQNVGEKMKVLHMHGIGSIPNTLGRYMDQHFNTENLVITLKKWDRFGHMVSGEVWDHYRRIFSLRFLLLARKFDIIHLHDRPYYLSYLHKLYPGKKLIIHLHGSSIRGQWDEKEKELRYADKIFVSTSDLLKGAPDGVLLLRNAVDTERFSPQNKQALGKALTRSYGAIFESVKAAHENSLTLTFMPDLVSYEDMPKLLGRFEYFIDIKRNPLGNDLLTRGGVLSMTGLQALAVGSKVIDSEGKIFKRLPCEHTPKYAATILYEHYRDLIEK